MPTTGKHIIIEIISSLLILLFVYTATSKLMDYKAFTTLIGRAPLVSGADNILPWALPVIEILIAIFLFIPSLRKMGMLLSFALMTIFTIYVGYVLSFEKNIPCSCGGILKHMTWTQHLYFNACFMFLALTGYILMHKNKFLIAIDRTS